MNFRKGSDKMRTEEKYIKLKDGREAILRNPSPDEAAEMVDFLKKVSAETDFLLRGADDEFMSVDEERKFLEGSLASKTGIMICCYVKDGEVFRHAGSVGLSLYSRKKLAHRANIGISVLKEFWGLGIGTAMMREVESIAKNLNILQLELEFVEGNSRARALYEKCGFRVAGLHPDAFLMPDGSMKNEYLMIKKI